MILWAATALGAEFSGASALGFTAKAVALGPRPPGSAAHRRLQELILSHLRGLSCEIIETPFEARTPRGRIAMKNIAALWRGRSGRAIAVSGHYDTKLMPALRFVGANDGGSSTGILMELARALAGQPRKDDVFLIWFDGEEAFGEWSATDGLYGSRHLSRQWSKDGTNARLKAMLNLDMVGDRDLGILQDDYSAPSLVHMIWNIAREKGYGKYFLDRRGAIEDDHVPFAQRGVRVIDLIDFDYGPGNSYWHTEKDTMDNLGEHSFQVVGDVVVETIRWLEQNN